MEGQDINELHREMINGSYLSIITHHIFEVCDGYRRHLSAYHTFTCPRGCITIARHGGAAKEWVNLGAWGLTHSDIYYKPLISSRTMQGD